MVPPQEQVEISSGLPAIYFPAVTGSGQELSETYHRIEIEPLVEPSAVCRVAMGGVPHFYFSYVNELATALEVPSDTSLNRFVPEADVEPETVLLPGEQGFARPESSFAEGTAWKLLGSTLALEEPIPICTDRGDYLCRKVPRDLVEGPEGLSREAVRRMARQAAKLITAQPARRSSDRFTPGFFKAAARTIGAVKKLVESVPPDVWSCEVSPTGCSEKRFPKKAIQAAFDRLCEQSYPPGLEALSETCKIEAKKLKTYLKTLPNTYVDCSGGSG